MTTKPTDLPTRLESVKTAVHRDPVLTSCEETIRAYQYFIDQGIREHPALHLTTIAIDNLWEDQ